MLSKNNDYSVLISLGFRITPKVVAGENEI